MVTKALSPTDSRFCGERTLTSWMRPTLRPAASTVPSVWIAIWDSGVPLGIVMLGLMPAEVGDQAALVVDVQVAVARQRRRGRRRA